MYLFFVQLIYHFPKVNFPFGIVNEGVHSINCSDALENIQELVGEGGRILGSDAYPFALKTSIYIYIYTQSCIDFTYLNSEVVVIYQIKIT